MSSHEKHRSITWEAHLSRRATWSRNDKDEYEFYERGNRLDYMQTNFFPADCERCIWREKMRIVQEDYEREQQEKERIRRIETERIDAEKKHEAQERRLMGAEDKPKPPVTPPVKRKATPEEEARWIALSQRKDALLAELADVSRLMERADTSRFDNDGECKACGVSYWGSSGYTDEAKKKRHLASHRHQVVCGLIKNEYPRRCEGCEYDAKDKHAWEQHCKGKKHQQKLDN
jgi:hypothetical protein